MVKNPAASAGDVGSIPGLGRCPGEGNGNPLQYSCLENAMDRGARQGTVHGVAKSQTQLSEHTGTFGNHNFVFCFCESVSFLYIHSFLLFFYILRICDSILYLSFSV